MYTPPVRTVSIPGDRWLDRFNRLWAIPTAMYILTDWLDFAQIHLPAWFRWIGSLILFSGALLFTWAHRSLDRNWTPRVELRPGHSLVTDGPYRWIRHPMYLSFMLISLGELLLSANWFVGLVFVPSLLIFALRVKREEELLSTEFGDSYRRYQLSTGRLLPKIPHRSEN